MTGPRSEQQSIIRSRQRLQAFRDQSLINRIGQIGKRIQQGTIQIENNSFLLALGASFKSDR